MLSQVAASKSRWKKDLRKIKSAVFFHLFLVGGDENEPSASVGNPAVSQRKQLKPAKLRVFTVVNRQRMLEWTVAIGYGHGVGGAWTLNAGL